MKILINTYPTIFQNKGGIQKRVIEHSELLNLELIETSIFEPKIIIKDYDIVTTFKPQYSNYDVFTYAKSQKLKTVTHAITEIPRNVFSLYLSKFLSLFPFTLSGIQKNILVNSDIVIALSESEKNLLINKYNLPEKKIKIIPNSVKSQRFISLTTPDCFVNKYLQPSDKYILCVGRIEPNKNQLKLVRALSHLNIKIVIIGQKVDEKYSKLISDYSNVLLIDNIDYSSDMLASAYKNAEIFILPSLNEISPNTIIEAALTGVPIICTKNTLTINEYFGKGILYINPYSTKDIQEKVKFILNNKHLFQDKLIDNTVEIFSEKNILSKHLNIYNSLV